MGRLRYARFASSCVLFFVIAVLCTITVVHPERLGNRCTNCVNTPTNVTPVTTKNITNLPLHVEDLGVKNEASFTSKYSGTHVPYVWETADAVCEDLMAVVVLNPTTKTNLFCFDFDSMRRVQLYKNLTPFIASAGPYLDAALKFLLDLFKLAPSQRVQQRFVWALEDDASFESSTAQNILRLPNVVILAHSVKEFFIRYTTFVPNFHFIASDGFEKLCTEFEKLDLPFADREKTVFWRGVSTGSDCWHSHEVEPCTCKRLQRVQAVEAAKNIEHTDLGIIREVQMCSSEDISGAKANSVPEYEWALRRGILDVDGNADAWGSFWRMCSRSLVFKVKSQYTSFFSSYFKEDVHFITIDQDLSDMENKTFLIKSDAYETLHRMEKIATKAYEVAQQLTYQRVVSHVAALVFK
jgi:hypothetical protein